MPRRMRRRALGCFRECLGTSMRVRRCVMRPIGAAIADLVDAFDFFDPHTDLHLGERGAQSRFYWIDAWIDAPGIGIAEMK
jgi:hypothetical protein